MIIEGEFFSGTHLRWNLGWPTPNYAGAFLAVLLALSFGLSGSRWRWVGLGVEAGGLFLLAKTYSRGALVAWALAWLFGVIMQRAWRHPAERALWAGRVIVLVAMLAVAGFTWSRAPVEKAGAIAGSAEDGSVVNRLALWRGGLAMMADAPLRGWGAGESGRGYMNWYQDVNREEGFSTMVNSFLHVGVEHGLWAVGAVVMGLAGLLAMAWEGARSGMKIGQVLTTDGHVYTRIGEEDGKELTANGREGTRMGDEKGEGLPAKDGERMRKEALKNGAVGITRPTLCVAAGAAWVAWATANVFTTLWIEPKLWIVPGIAAGIILWAMVGAAAAVWRRVILTGVVGGGLVTAGLWGAGLALASRQPWVAKPGDEGAVVVTARSAVGAGVATLHVWADNDVLGPTPGKELRRWLAAQPGAIRLVVHRATAVISPVEGASVMLVGGQVARLGAIGVKVRDCWIVHPTALPPVPQVGEGAWVTVLLPELDESGVGVAWRSWVEASGARVRVTPSSGQDIRAAWPGVMVAAADASNVAEKIMGERR